MIELKNKKLISLSEASERTGLTLAALYKRTSCKDLPYYKIGRRIFFDVAELEAGLLSHRYERIEA